MSHHMCVNCLMCSMAKKRTERNKKFKKTDAVYVDDSAPDYLGNLPLDDIMSLIEGKSPRRGKSKRCKSKEKKNLLETEAIGINRINSKKELPEVHKSSCCGTDDCETNPSFSAETEVNYRCEDAVSDDDNWDLDLNGVIEKANLLLHDVNKNLEPSITRLDEIPSPKLQVSDSVSSTSLLDMIPNIEGLKQKQNKNERAKKDVNKNYGGINDTLDYTESNEFTEGKSRSSRRKRQRVKSNEIENSVVEAASDILSENEAVDPEIYHPAVFTSKNEDGPCEKTVNSPEYYIYAKVLRFQKTDEDKKNETVSSASVSIRKERCSDTEPLKINVELRDSIKEHLKKSFMDYFRRREERNRLSKKCAVEHQEAVYGRATAVDYSLFEAGTSSSFSESTKRSVYNY